MKTLMILGSEDWRIGVIVFLGIGFGLYVLDKWFGKGSSDAEKNETLLSDKTEDTKESFSSTDEQLEKIYKVLNHMRWILLGGFLYIILVVSGILPAGVFS